MELQSECKTLNTTINSPRHTLINAEGIYDCRLNTSISESLLMLPLLLLLEKHSFKQHKRETKTILVIPNGFI